jgi:hypothetical protein
MFRASTKKINNSRDHREMFERITNTSDVTANEIQMMRTMQYYIITSMENREQKNKNKKQSKVPYPNKGGRF